MCVYVCLYVFVCVSEGIDLGRVECWWAVQSIVELCVGVDGFVGHWEGVNGRCRVCLYVCVCVGV